MATRAQPTPEPLEVALSVIPSLPRPVLARIVARAIERLDEIDGDADAKDMAWPEWNGWANSGDTSQSEDDEDSHDREAIDEREMEDGQ